MVKIPLNEKGKEDLKKEIELHRKLTNNYISLSTGSFQDDNKDELYVFYNKYEDLFSFISKATPLQRIKYVHQLLLGFSFLEGNKIFHGDIKIENLLYDRNSDQVKICK